MSLRRRPILTPALRAWCKLGREERRLHAFARQLGNVQFPRRTATLWALSWTPLRLGGVGTNPEYAVKSTDRFLTSLARIQIDIRDQLKVPLLKFWVRRSPLRPLTMGGGQPPRFRSKLAGRRVRRGRKRRKACGCGGTQTPRRRGGRNKPGMCCEINR
jgi:hypothetical protein